MINEDEPIKIITVGDVVSENLVNHNVSPNILIVDNRVMRKEITPIPVKAEKTYHIKNPPGTLTDESWIVMEAIISHKQLTKVIVDGEEDLLALVAILTAPYGSYVIYGQPHQGIVVVKVTKRVKDKIRKLVDSMEELPSRKTKVHGFQR